MSKILKKCCAQEITPDTRRQWNPPDQQFGFGQKHSTLKQVHRITEIIRGILEKKTVLLCGILRYHTNV
jgi:hypothetical protein